MEGDLGPLTASRWKGLASPICRSTVALFIFMIVAMGLALMRFRRTLD